MKKPMRIGILIQLLSTAIENRTTHYIQPARGYLLQPSPSPTELPLDCDYTHTHNTGNTTVMLSIRPGAPCLYNANSKKTKSSGFHLGVQCTLICTTFIRSRAAGRCHRTGREKSEGRRRRGRQGRRTRRDISLVSDKT